MEEMIMVTPNVQNDWFVEVCDGLKRKTPPEMIEFSKLQEWQAQHQSSDDGLFASICRYPTDDPYVGGVVSDFFMDFDCEENPDKARKEAVATVKKLIFDYEVPEAIVDIAFSGKKGFAITIFDRVFSAETLDYLPLVWKSIIQEFAVKLKLRTVDTSIYERRRLWRLLNSRHQKTGLYKIPLTLTELEKLSIEEIKGLATKPREPFAKADVQPVSKAVRLFLEHKIRVENWANERKRAFENAELKTLIDDPPCVKLRLEIGAEKGERNSFAFQIAVYYSSRGLGYDDILRNCTAFAARCEDPLTEREMEILINSAIKGAEEKKYSVGCSSEALVDLCDKTNCPFFCKQENKENKCSCGGDLPHTVFEQGEKQEFLVYDKETGEISRQKTVEGTKPINQLLWKTVDRTLDFGSEQELWDEIRQYLYDHIDISEGYDALTAWLLSSWIPEKWHAVPYLFFYGPPASGKTWALEVLASIGFRPFMSASATLASVFRVIDQWHPTMFLDETEVYMKKDRDEILNLLNAGYRKGFPAVRVEETD
jgi:hypothetical protein